MRIECPLCGARDRREFYYAGHAGALERPDPEASAEVWDDYLHNRDNWLVVHRDTVTHAVLAARLAKGDQL
jgi:sarcosine oxidase delta subunit